MRIKDFRAAWSALVIEHFLLLAVSIILIWTYIAFDLRRAHDEAFHHARQQLANLTHVYAEEVSSSIASIDYVSIDLREEWKWNPVEFDAMLLFRQVHLDPRVAFNVGIIDAQGTLVYTNANWKTTPLDLSDREYFKYHYYNRGDGLHISEPVLLRVANRLAIQFTRPLPAARNEFNGIIAVSVSPEYFSRFHENIELGKDSTIVLARTTGELLARHPEPDLVLQQPIRDAPWIGRFADEQGFFQKPSEIDKIERLYSWRIIKDGGLAVVMGQSVSTILSSYQQQRTTYIWWGTVATLFLLLGGYLLGKYRLQRTQAAADMQKMEEALARSQKLESIGKLTGGVAHDFNNLLQIISSNIQLLEMTGKINEDIEPHLKSIADATERGAKLAAQILTFARRQPLHPTTINLVKLLEGIDALIQRLVGSEIEVRMVMREDSGNVRADAGLLENVILNLAANARDAMNGKGTLSIELANEVIDAEKAIPYPGIVTGEYVSLSLSDTGSGMSEEVMEHAFEPFFTTKPEGKGTGLGLAAAYGFVRGSGGYIHIESALGKGTTIKILLPRSFEEVESAPTAPSASSGSGKGTILFVDDNTELRTMMGIMLEHLGYRVVKAANAREALAILEKGGHIDVLFTDIRMPGPIDGLELATQAKSMQPDLSILVASGSENVEQLADDFMQSEDIAYMNKPYGIQEATATLQNLLAQKRKDR